MDIRILKNGKIKFADFFCGIGSFHYSFKKLGWNCVTACDIDSAARQTYLRNYNVEPLGDVSEINPNEIPTYDILCAGISLSAVQSVWTTERVWR